MQKQSICFIVVTAAVAMVGCVKAVRTSERPAFERQELDGCMAILIDMSGSFADAWEERAYELFIELSESYFTEAMGTNNRLVISQLSGNDRVVVFEGAPVDLTRQFRSPEELNQFLKKKSDPSRSRVYASVSETLDYLSSMDGVTERTRLMTVVMSDLRDSESDQEKRNRIGQEMVESMNDYRNRGGALALYFVASDEVPRWKDILDRAGFLESQYVIQNELTRRPQLPRFD
ncbi:hypothetical protein Mal65_11180 [Crateriforma conspicua]|nr:hypothetical protein Mal65_11180 [Crateriforma conspicua]